MSVFWARFETPVLLQVCEGLLVERVDDSSVFQLLEVAELYRARHLRVSLCAHSFVPALLSTV